MVVGLAACFGVRIYRSNLISQIEIKQWAFQLVFYEMGIGSLGGFLD